MNQETLASGRYVLDRVIGAGGMADVYRARDTRLHRDVAVKMFRRGSAEGVARGSGEARMLAALHHPGLVRVLDMDAECARLEPSYLVMEYIKGPDLGAVLRDGALPIHSTTTAARDIARTLEYIHGQGIVHRDIKPSNVLTRYGETSSGMFSFLLTDFGIARFFESSRVTATGSLIGTATYFSPEQARGDRVGTPTDIYALGLLLIECLTGEPAFPGTGLESALARLSRPPAIPESFGEGWHHLLTMMTVDDPLERPTAATVVRLLDAIDVPSEEAGLTAGNNAGLGAEETTTTEAPSQVRSLPRLPAQPPSGQPTLEALDMETASHPEPPRRRAAARARMRARALAAVVVLVGLTFAVLLIVFDLNAGPGPTPLPAVPGSTGAMLDSLYESVQP
ncbi:hypothetical protein ASH00_11405 [Arthrobacter sp. Soil782]|uniref:serine/threonine-protein kinase n=1 Tax=Arthrobacter sp. Soil782 TaxID=1736410 RepID=UPI0007016BA6|nr:serine/threonine-protein kinase [Arthrobacter sp. Soil782]KRF05049.1 hypothetical protein ASH00_11405 [Arthrobacter sp. Soil782]